MSDALIFGCGYLGRRIAARWLADGRKVLATTRGRAQELRSLGIDPIVADVLNPASLASLPAVSTVVYCVGMDRAVGATMRDVYVQGLANVLAALPRPARLIYVSSTSVYGQSQGEEVDETSFTGPQDESGKIVLEAEHVLFSAVPEAIVLRFSGIYGPGRLLRREHAIRSGEPIVADLDGWLNLIHVDDGVSAVLAAEQGARAGAVYNVSDGAPMRRRDFYTQLTRALGAPAPALTQEPPGIMRTNRRVVNRKMLAELGVTLKYRSPIEGLAACVSR